MKDPYVISLDVEHPGDDGIIPYTDMVTVAVLSGDPGGYDGEFEQYLIDVLEDWFDGAHITVATEPSTFGFPDIVEGLIAAMEGLLLDWHDGTVPTVYRGKPGAFDVATQRIAQAKSMINKAKRNVP